MQNGKATLEDSLVVSYKTKYGLAKLNMLLIYDSAILFGIYPRS